MLSNFYFSSVVSGKKNTNRMETFQECGVQMLREFRALLQQTPLPVNQTRLLQLLALNMFAVSNTQLKGKKTSTQKMIINRLAMNNS